MLIQTHIIRNYGTDHEYFNNRGLAALWQDITGRKTIDSNDKASLETLGQMFGQTVEFELTAGPVLGVTVHAAGVTSVIALRPPTN